ncbi:MAG: hypothetical protein II541_07765, partial [Prevotella sp.]|nr:hypothetical protein [Prevotella sp.]
KIFALSDSVEVENSEERLLIVPVDRFTTPFVMSDMHCFVFRLPYLVSFAELYYCLPVGCIKFLNFIYI